jgi:GNAT superfamily N-acetyltransferase
MNYQKYSSEINKYELGQGFYLQRAENPEFTKFWVVYRNVNEDFAQSFKETQQELTGVPFCFWIMSEKYRIGGAVLLPNGIGDFFLIPPADDAQKILALVMPLLETWSDDQKLIGAQAIQPQYLEAFQSVGFVLEESRFWMIRPTEKIKMEPPNNWSLQVLTVGKSEEIAQLLKSAFSGGVGQYGARDYEAHLSSVEQYFESFEEKSVCGQASTISIDKESGQVLGVCMVEIHKGLPSIRFVAVAPNFQGQGIAKNLINHAINTLEPKYDWVKLAVSVENPAVNVYRKLGFVPSDTLSQLTKLA